MSGRYSLRAEGVIEIVALMSSLGFSGISEIFPVTLMGIPFTLPSVLLRVRVFPEYVKFTEGLMIFCPHPENSGLLISPVTLGLEAVPFTVTEAVISPSSLY